MFQVTHTAGTGEKIVILVRKNPGIHTGTMLIDIAYHNYFFLLLSITKLEYQLIYSENSKIKT